MPDAHQKNEATSNDVCNRWVVCGIALEVDHSPAQVNDQTHSFGIADTVALSVTEYRVLSGRV
jgi:hypothetical protein